MSVKLREKQLSTGQVSFYLDIYHNRARWYEWLNIHINKNKPTAADKDNRRLANEIRAKREHELIVLDNGLIDKKKKLSDFVEWFEKYLKGKKTNNQYGGALSSLKLFQGARRVKNEVEENGKVKRKIVYTGHRPLPFAHINVEWINSFKSDLLKRVKNNTAISYLDVVKAALLEAERVNIIPKSPFKLLEKKDKLTKKPIFRSSFTLEQLQMLADTPCEIEPQYRQLFFFSCFSGLRWSDANCLKWTEILVKRIEGTEEWFIYFEQEKTEGIEYLPLSAQAIEILKQRKAERKAEGDKSLYVFPKCKEIEETKIVYRKVYYAMKKWGRITAERYPESGITDKMMKPHTGRHTFATNVQENSEDGDLYTTSKLLGHKSIQATQIYAHVRDRKKMKAIKDLPKINLQVVHSKAA